MTGCGSCNEAEMSKVLTIDLESFLCLWLGTCSSSALSSHPSARIRAKCQQTARCLVWWSLAIVPTRRLFSVPVSDVWSWHNLSHNTIHWHCLITAAYESFLLLLSAPDPRGNSGQWGAAGSGGACSSGGGGYREQIGSCRSQWKSKPFIVHTP